MKNNETTLREISDKILVAGKENVSSIYCYGSALTNHFSARSDFDVLVILKNDSAKNLLKLRQVAKNFAKKKIKVDINVQNVKDMPRARKDAFWHNNRGIFIQCEIANYGKLLFGENYFSKKFCDFNFREMKLEAVRVLNSLVYQARKTLLNKNLTKNEKYIIFKHCLYVCEYALAAKNIFPEKYDKILAVFREKFPNLENPEIFARQKLGEISNIKKADIFRAYDFLRAVDKEVFKIYQGKND